MLMSGPSMRLAARSRSLFTPVKQRRGSPDGARGNAVATAPADQCSESEIWPFLSTSDPCICPNPRPFDALFMGAEPSTDQDVANVGP
jgi:hypothetical protein